MLLVCTVIDWVADKLSGNAVDDYYAATSQEDEYFVKRHLRRLSRPCDRALTKRQLKKDIQHWDVECWPCTSSNVVRVLAFWVTGSIVSCVLKSVVAVAAPAQQQPRAYYSSRY